MVRKLTNIAAALVKETFLVLSESLIGQKNFAMVFLKTLISINESNHRIEKSLSNLIQEPFLTAIDQFKIGCKLEGTSKDDRTHRENRFRDSLKNFDKALSLAKAEEKAFINLMRGLCAINIPGGLNEAKIHFKAFQKDCIKKASELKCKADSLIDTAKENEIKASKINTDDLPKGLGGGTLISISVAEPKMKKATLLTKAREDRAKADQLMKESSVLLIASEDIKKIIDNA